MVARQALAHAHAPLTTGGNERGVSLTMLKTPGRLNACPTSFLRAIDVQLVAQAVRLRYYWGQ